MATKKFLNADTNESLGGSNSSHEHVPSQKAVKTYVDNKIANNFWFGDREEFETLVSGSELEPEVEYNVEVEQIEFVPDSNTETILYATHTPTQVKEVLESGLEAEIKLLIGSKAPIYLQPVYCTPLGNLGEDYMIGMSGVAAVPFSGVNCYSVIGVTRYDSWILDISTLATTAPPGYDFRELTYSASMDIAIGTQAVYAIINATGDIVLSLTSIENYEENHIIVYADWLDSTVMNLDFGTVPSGMILIGELKTIPISRAFPFDGSPNITNSPIQGIDITVQKISSSKVILSWKMIGYKS